MVTGAVMPMTGFLYLAMMGSVAVELDFAATLERAEGSLYGVVDGGLLRGIRSAGLRGRQHHVEQSATHLVGGNAVIASHLLYRVLEVLAGVAVETRERDLPALELDLVGRCFGLHICDAMLRPVPAMQASPRADGFRVAAQPAIANDGEIQPGVKELVENLRSALAALHVERVVVGSVIESAGGVVVVRAIRRGFVPRHVYRAAHLVDEL